MLKNKRGQYYLIASIVIVALIISFAVITNSVTKRSEKGRVYELYCQINIDNVKAANFNLAEYGNSYSIYEMTILLNDLAQIYPGVENTIYFVPIPILTGLNAEEKILKVKAYSYKLGEEELSEINILELIIPNKIKITIEGKEYYFDFDETKASYIIIIDEKDGEQYVVNG
jgi:hypothetical protein